MDLRSWAGRWIRESAPSLSNAPAAAAAAAAAASAAATAAAASALRTTPRGLELAAGGLEEASTEVAAARLLPANEPSPPALPPLALPPSAEVAAAEAPVAAPVCAVR